MTGFAPKVIIVGLAIGQSATTGVSGDPAVIGQRAEYDAVAGLLLGKGGRDSCQEENSHHRNRESQFGSKLHNVPP